VVVLDRFRNARDAHDVRAQCGLGRCDIFRRNGMDDVRVLYDNHWSVRV